MALLRCVVEL